MKISSAFKSKISSMFKSKIRSVFKSKISSATYCDVEDLLLEAHCRLLTTKGKLITNYIMKDGVEIRGPSNYFDNLVSFANDIVKNIQGAVGLTNEFVQGLVDSYKQRMLVEDMTDDVEDLTGEDMPTKL